MPALNSLPGLQCRDRKLLPPAGLQPLLHFDEGANLLELDDFDERATLLDLEELGGFGEPLAGVSYVGSFASAVSLGATARDLERLPALDLGQLDSLDEEPTGKQAAFSKPCAARFFVPGTAVS